MFIIFEMGNIFSLAKRNKQAALSHQQAIEQQQLEEEALNKKIEEANAIIESIAVEQYRMLLNDAQTRIRDIQRTIQLAIDQREFIKAIIIRSSVLICALIYNYPFGVNATANLDSEIQQSWETNAEEMIEMTVIEDVWMQLCKIPMLLPALWPTGALDASFHTYKDMNVTARDPNSVNEYDIIIKSQIANYMPRLKNYVRNIFKFNVKSVLDVKDITKQTEINAKCAEFIKNASKIDQLNAWLRFAIKFMSDQPSYLWKTLSAKSNKGICPVKIHVVPKTYPRLNPYYELYCAIITILNSIYNNIGEILDADMNRIKVNKEAEVLVKKASINVHGGQCFDFNVKWYENSCVKAYDEGFDIIWDGKSYKYVDDVWMSLENIVDIKQGDLSIPEYNTKWISETKLLDSVDVIWNKPETGNPEADASREGYLKYKNPTFDYSSTFLNDVGKSNLLFKMPRIGAYLGESKVVINMFKEIQNINKYNVLGNNNPNANLMNFLEFLITNPNTDAFGYEPPVSKFIYWVLIQNSCIWNLTFPIDNTMSFCKINNLFIKNLKDEKLLPQNVLRATPWNLTVGNVDNSFDAEGEFKQNINTEGIDVIKINAADVDAAQKAYVLPLR